MRFGWLALPDCGFVVYPMMALLRDDIAVLWLWTLPGDAAAPDDIKRHLGFVGYPAMPLLRMTPRCTWALSAPDDGAAPDDIELHLGFVGAR